MFFATILRVEECPWLHIAEEKIKMLGTFAQTAQIIRLAITTSEQVSQQQVSYVMNANQNERKEIVANLYTPLYQLHWLL